MAEGGRVTSGSSNWGGALWTRGGKVELNVPNFKPLVAPVPDTLIGLLTLETLVTLDRLGALTAAPLTEAAATEGTGEAIGAAEGDSTTTGPTLEETTAAVGVGGVAVEGTVGFPKTF